MNDASIVEKVFGMITAIPISNFRVLESTVYLTYFTISRRNNNGSAWLTFLYHLT